MKTKFLLPMLAGLALVSCNSEEFISEKAENQNSPITFSVSKDGADDLFTRASIGGETGSSVMFEKGDLISMFHNLIVDGTSFAITGGQNAIFEGTTTDADGGSLKFTTKSMIQAGKAILVYPADTTFTYTDADLAITIPVDQTASTKLIQPYMSDEVTIANYDGSKGESNSAGYGRNYEVPLKKVGSLLQMRINAANKNLINNITTVAPVAIKKVTISAGESELLFNNSVLVASSSAATSLITPNAAPNSDAKKFAHLLHQTVLTDGTTKVPAISSTDVSADDVCYFTLLPNITNITELKKNATIKVETNYGSVLITNTAEKYPLTSKTVKTQTLNVALLNIINNTWKENAKSANFKGEKTGASFKRDLAIDMKDLNMTGTVVTNSQELIDLLTVYSALGKTDKIDVLLAGKDNRFEMTGAALDKLIAVNATNAKVTLDLAGADKVDFIVLADADATIEKLNNKSIVLKSGKTTEAPLADVILKSGLNWAIDQALVAGNIKSISNEGNLMITNTTASKNAFAVSLNNAVGGALTFDGTARIYLGAFTTLLESKTTIATGQTVQLNGNTELLGEIDNSGILTANAVVTNKGYIDNKFEVSVIKGSTAGKFINLGTIFNNGSKAVTYITENQNTENIGAIILTERNDQVSIQENQKQGYIKYTLKPSKEGKYIYTHNDKDVFNWLIIDTQKEINEIVDVTLNSDIKYLTFTGKVANVKANSITVTDLFVKNGMRLMVGNTLITTDAYVADYILHAGGLTLTTQNKVYDSKTVGEKEDKLTYANGQIRTVGNTPD